MHRLFIVLLSLCLATWAFAGDLNLSPKQELPLKGQGHSDMVQDNFDGREGGEITLLAVPITTMPYADTGYTCDNLNDYDAVCPYGGSTAPDVVYSYEAVGDQTLLIDLCLSQYDTKVYVLDSGLYVVDCNDDFYDGIDPPECLIFSSYLEANLYGGQTYYVVVDGYGTSCGDYDIQIDSQPWTPPPPCEVVCDVNAQPEGEPTLVADYDDTLNGGCNDEFDYVFQPLNWIDEETGCMHLSGVSGWYPFTGLQYRDTDWFEVVAAGTEISVAFETDNDVTLSWIAFSTPNPDCLGAWDLAVSINDIEECDPRTFTTPTNPGDTYWILVLPSAWVSGPLEWNYCLEVCGAQYQTIPNEDKSWGDVKSLYR